MNRPLVVWIAFLACLALVLGSMGFVSLTVLRLDAHSVEARRRAALEENVRLALWRMDSAVAPLIGRENTRAAHAYQAFHPAPRAYTRMYAQLDVGEVRIPSPLLTERHPHIRLHFQLLANGSLSSPQAPVGNMRDLAESGHAAHASIAQASQRLAELKQRLNPEAVRREVGADTDAGLASQSAMQARSPAQAPQKAAVARNSFPGQQRMSANEWQARFRTARQVVTNLAKRSSLAQPDQRSKSETGPLQQEPEAGLMRPVWQGDELLLVRRVRVDGRAVVQGCWLDWPAMRRDLLTDVADLLPEAKLLPLSVSEKGPTVRRLASLPVRLRPGPVGEQPLEGLSPIQISLLVAWAFALLAAFAVGGVLQTTMSLSERRGAFVSAVTHELRTPLTTFRLYTEMLADGLVTDASKRQDYHRTLHAEAQRLDHLVQNVLSYAQLEKNSRGANAERVALGELIERSRDRLAERARQGEMDLVVGVDPRLAGVEVVVDPEAICRILFNLVDNACKYAGGASDRRIHLEAQLSAARVVVRVRDHGPGVDRGLARRLFRPFSKSAQAAAESAAGVGLGLALSRRLARRMGGELSLKASAAPGATFELFLPRT